MNRLCVVGAIHMDLVIATPRFPRAGERLAAEDFSTCPGGKGANQAVGAARLGADVDLVGCVGDDGWGGDLRGALVAEGVDARHVVTKPDHPTGVAVVGVLPEGRLGVIVAPGADLALDEEDVERAREAIEEAALLVLQVEYPLPALLRAVEIARAKSVPVLLNASPPQKLPPELLQDVDLMVADHAEAEVLLGEEGVGAAGVARRLGALGPRRVAVTERGLKAVLFDGEKVSEAPGFDEPAVDATGVRDAFTAALAVAQLEGLRTDEALRSACAAGTLASLKRGAMPSLPTREELEAFLAKHPR